MSDLAWAAVVCLAFVAGWLLGRVSARLGRRGGSVHNPRPRDARPPSSPPRPPGVPWSETVKGG